MNARVAVFPASPCLKRTCGNSVVSRYQANPPVVCRISGTLLDRADRESGRALFGLSLVVCPASTRR